MDIREQAEENLNLKYKLMVENDDETFFEESFLTLEALQLSVDKAQASYDQAVEKEIEYIEWDGKNREED